MPTAVLVEPPPAIETTERAETSLLRRVLQDRAALLGEIAAGKKCALAKIVAVSFALTALGGLGLGASHGAQQALSSAGKLPLINLSALAISFPAFYIFAALQGSKLSLEKTLKIFAVGLGLRGAVIAALAPVLIFFSSVGSPYGFILLAGGLTFAIADAGFLRTLDQGVTIWKERTGDKVGLGLVRGWMILYLVVGMQLTWSLRPVIGEPQEAFMWLRHCDDGNMLVFFFKNVVGLFH